VILETNGGGIKHDTDPAAYGEQSWEGLRRGSEETCGQMLHIRDRVWNSQMML